jgi:hypothetical protein
VDRIISEMQLVADQIRSNARLLRTTTPGLLRRNRNEVAGLNQLAGAYGLTDCLFPAQPG